MKVFMIGVVGGRAVVVTKLIMDIPNEVLTLEEYDEDIVSEHNMDEGLWFVIKDFVTKKGDSNESNDATVQSFCIDEVDGALGFSNSDYNEMKKVLSNVFVNEYKCDDMWKQIETTLDEMEWDEEPVFI